MVFILALNSVYSQEVGNCEQELRLNRDYFKSYWTDTRKIVSSPFHWDKKNWIIAGSVTAMTVFTYIYDENIRDVFQRNQSGFLDNSSEYFFEPMGRGLISIPLLGGFFLYGSISKNKKPVRVALNGAKAFILTGAFTYVIKHLTHRHRPNQDFPANSKLWEGPFASFDYDAFPSGHTSTAFAVATIFALEYKDKLWVPILSYILASGAGLSRIYDDKHWASDVIVGAALGYGIGRLVYMSSLNRTGLAIVPVFGGQTRGGVIISYNF